MAAQDLCVLADVRALLQKKVGDTAQDALIGSLITRASDAIMRRVDRQFAPYDAGPTTHSFEWAWEGQFVSVAPYDLNGLPVSVTIDADQPGGGIAISVDEWRPWPVPPRDGTYLALRLQPFSAKLGRVMWNNRRVDVVGAWGFTAIPSDVVQACAITVVHWLTVNVAAFRSPDNHGAALPGVVPQRGIPPEAWDLLGPYMRAYTA